MLRDEPTIGAVVQIILLALLWQGVGLGPAGWLAGIAYALVVWACLGAALRRTRSRALGAANRVTLARSLLVGGVSALVADHVARDTAGPGHALTGFPLAVLVTLAATALVLDAVDGQVARRTRTISALGARFDMEVDAFLILVLSIFVAGTLGTWVLAIGVMRYAFAAAAWVLPWLRKDLPPSIARKTVAALQGIVLAAASPGILPRWLVLGAVALALTSLVWSFGRDLRWLWRARARL
jgi:phosphatidylglycerophosphate synthase